MAKLRCVQLCAHLSMAVKMGKFRYFTSEDGAAFEIARLYWNGLNRAFGLGGRLVTTAPVD